MSLYLHILETAAVWRITHLLSKEDGPFDIVFIIRRKAGSGFLGSLIDCFYCLSIWVTLPFGCWSGNDWKEKLLIWFALSGSACLLEQATARRNPPSSPPHYFEDKKLTHCLVVGEKEMELLNVMPLTALQLFSGLPQKCGKTYCLCIPAKQG